MNQVYCAHAVVDNWVSLMSYSNRLTLNCVCHSALTLPEFSPTA